MPTLTTEKIIKQINNYFAEGYQYVIWYDSKQEFIDIINEISSQITVKLYIAQEKQQFKTKYDLLQDADTPYLIYAPYTRPTIQLNYLTDIEHYSKLFTADATHIILEELGLDDDKLQFLKKYSDFFKAKSRRESFKKYWSESFSSNPAEGIIAAITRTDKLDLNDLLMKVIAENTNPTNKYIYEFAKYDVLNTFWKLIQESFAYNSEDPSIEDLLTKLFITYLANETNNLPKRLSKYVLDSSDNVEIFIDRFSDSNRYREYYDNESTKTWNKLDLAGLLEQESLDDLVKITIFEEVNKLILTKLRQRIDGQRIIDYELLMSIISKMTDHHRNNYSNVAKFEYKFLQYTAELLNSRIPVKDTWKEALDSYINEDYKIDTIYRKSLLTYENIISDNVESYKTIKNNLDLYYGNVLLNDSVKQWNDTFDLAEVKNNLQQSRFYRNYVDDIRERVVVIFSDALRYEVGQELEDKLDNNDRLSLKMNYALTGLPSVTYTGMNVMLPHNKLTWDEKANKVRVNDMRVDTTDARTKLLQSYNDQNVAAQLKDILTMTSKEIKQFISGKNIIYLYHNQIDVKGHETKTTNGLVSATEKAIEEIKQTIQVLRTNGVSHIIVTADHGFIYQEREIADVDKIDLSDENYRGQAHLRYLITPDEINVMGVKKTTMGVALHNSDQNNIYYATSPNVFVAKSGSKNYVHGGSSLQEMLIPILDIKATSKRSQAKPAQIKLAATTFRINNLKMNLLFNQTASISDLILSTEYKAYFTDELENLISNVATIVADRIGSAADRTIPISITIQDKDYDRNKNYYLVIESSNGDKKKYNYQMDLF